MRTFDVVAIGNALVDVLIETDERAIADGFGVSRPTTNRHIDNL